MAFDGNEGARITLEEGAALTKMYRDNHPNSIKGMFVGRTHIEALLAQSNCKGLRMYLGENTKGEMELVMVSADANGDDILDIIVDRMVKCPTNCPGDNPLNTELKK